MRYNQALFRLVLLRASILAALTFLLGGGILPLSTSKAATASVPRVDLVNLSQHKELWPASVTLKSDVTLTIMLEGKIAGTLLARAGTEVSLAAVDGKGLSVLFASAQGTVTQEQTDLAERVASAAAAAAAAKSKAAASQAVAQNTPKPASPPAAPPQPTPPSKPIPLTSPSAASTAASTPPPSPANDSIRIDSEEPAAFNYSKSAFRFWSPSSPADQPIRGVILLFAGLEGDGRPIADDKRWQLLATKYHLALLGIFVQKAGAGPSYEHIDKGTGALLLRVLHNMAGKTGHPEVENAPLLIYGAPGSGMTCYNFAVTYPERILAFLVNFAYGCDPIPQRDSVQDAPALFFIPAIDETKVFQTITKAWKDGWDRGARWALTAVPNDKRDGEELAALARVFFDEALPLRLPADGATSLQSIPVANGWVGNTTTFAIRHADATLLAENEVWFPGQKSAEAWRKHFTEASPAAQAQAAAADEVPAVRVDVEETPKANYSKAAFRFWSPVYAADQPIRGVILLFAYNEGDGRNIVDWKLWQRLAVKHHLALLGTYIQSAKPQSYSNIRAGSGDLLLQVLRDVAAQTSRPEIETAPLLLYGGAGGGGEICYNFAMSYPNRVLAFIVHRGATYTADTPSEGVRNIPAIFIVRENEATRVLQNTVAVWKAGASRGALWTQAVGPAARCNDGEVSDLSQSFFDEVIPLRLPAAGQTQLNPVDYTKGLIGNLTRHDVRYSDGTSLADDDVWLPGPQSARAWRKFVVGKEEPFQFY